MEVRQLLNDEDDVLVAVAALLLEMAHIDGEFSDREAELLIDMLGADISRSLVEGEALFVRARALLRRAESIDAIALAMRERFEPNERLGLVTALWRVARADGRVDRYEAYLVNRIARLLDVPARFGPSR